MPFGHRSTILRRLLLGIAILILLSALTVVVVARGLAAAPYRGSITDHFDGRLFHNLDVTADKTFKDILQWRRTSDRKAWSAWIDEPPGLPPPPGVDDGSIRITWINHASFLIQLDGINVITDPVFSDRVSP